MTAMLQAAGMGWFVRCFATGLLGIDFFAATGVGVIVGEGLGNASCCSLASCRIAFREVGLIIS